ncbi:MAG: IS1634 family transposase [Desulfobacterales bacterium]
MKQIEAQYKQVDVLPMVKHYMNSLDLYNLFKKYVPCSTNCLAEHAESLCIITANIICDNKPLYKVQEWLAKYADGLANESVNADKFNDDRLGRSLSALFKADRHSLMTEVSCSAIKLHKLLTDEIHNDSTTVTFIGEYANPDPDAVQLKQGHNKDFRPDCKQIVFGLNITADGHVPLSYKAYNGNRNDDTTHIPNWNELRSLIQKEDFIYIADCKLCSSKNLAYIDENNGYFITIIPKFHKESKSFIQYIKSNDVKWEDAFEIRHSRKKKEINKFRTYEAGKNSKGYRIIWVHSSSKEQNDKNRRLKKIDKAQKALEELIPKLNAYHLKTQKQITKAVNKICKEVEGLIDVKITKGRKQICKRIPSTKRRASDPIYENKWSFNYGLEWKINEQAAMGVSKTDGLFPLITNNHLLDAADVLRMYKRQSYLEKRMYTKKSILDVAPVFLKKESRIEAVLLLYFFALMIVSLIERNIRLNMTKQKIEKLPILPQKMNTKKPTWNNIRYFCRNIHLSVIIKNKIPIQTNIQGFSDLHKKVCKLIEVPCSAYKNLHDGWWLFEGT